MESKKEAMAIEKDEEAKHEEEKLKPESEGQ
jgi:hypothetical protein